MKLLSVKNIIELYRNGIFTLDETTLSIVRSIGSDLEIDPELFEEQDVIENLQQYLLSWQPSLRIWQGDAPTATQISKAKQRLQLEN
ncbi:MAG: hypothetical protein R3C11_04255 [Planctomycetaceae bacterium]